MLMAYLTLQPGARARAWSTFYTLKTAAGISSASKDLCISAGMDSFTLRNL